MKFLTSYLQPGETVMYRARIHLFIFAQPLIILILGYYFWHSSAGLNHYLGLTLLFLGLVSLIQRLCIKLGSIFAVTNLRLIFKTGIIGRKTRDLILLKIEGLWITQSIIGRICNYGTIVVSTGGVTNTYTYVASPMRFKREVDICIEGRYNREA
ncbi:PH domain-containing protein [Bacteroides sp. 51]|uniref:PH domain-containing protein n=1 Tax=Bacteroides sp. 51 TaxID=2302938 RepID=UPI0013D40E2F|nr:PH domain-containing protein [Bacteroides sp. 51]NDV84527.1 PH domain-containing protein [Bacteroides sp. 51]